MLLHDRKIFRLTRGSPSRTEKFFGSLGNSPSRTKFFLFIGGRGSCRAVILAVRQVGRSANRQVRMSARKFFGSLGSSPSRTEKFFWLTRGSSSPKGELPSEPDEFFLSHQLLPDCFNLDATIKREPEFCWCSFLRQFLSHSSRCFNDDCHFRFCFVPSPRL